MVASSIYTKYNINLYDQGKIQDVSAMIVNEAPLTLYLNDVELATLVCSPEGYRELGVGFLATEGLITNSSDIREISCREDEGLLWIHTNSPVPQAENFLRRQIASCCGKGRALLYFVNDARQMQRVESDAQFDIANILSVMTALDEKSATYRATGGVHSAGLGSGRDLAVMYEDIGRHNAVDKVLGYTLLNGMGTVDKFLLLTGRVSSEILIKAARLSIPLVVSRAAPTMLAVELAGELGITLVGFARGRSLSIYSHVERISS
jgi:FdhD protein